MDAIQIHFSSEMKRLVEAQAAARGFDTASEYVRALVEADRDGARRAEIEQALLEAMDGPSTPLTAQDFDDIRRQGRAIIERRRQGRSA